VAAVKSVLVGAVVVLVSSSGVDEELITGEVVASELESGAVPVGTLEDRGTEELV
jgi:hypothetical protein